jgi:hypothetical protein
MSVGKIIWKLMNQYKKSVKLFCYFFIYILQLGDNFALDFVYKDLEIISCYDSFYF